ncbi:MAG: DUF3592 domain-containing protein [Planctomycetaceae bacterium]|nr:DUF3592 domain-containing protein [Planctomycetaceae bacterium]
MLEDPNSDYSLLLEPPENFLFNGEIEEDTGGNLRAIRNFRISNFSWLLLGVSPFVLGYSWWILGVFRPIDFDASGIVDLLIRLIYIGMSLIAILFVPIYEWWGNRQAKKKGHVCLRCNREGEVQVPVWERTFHKDQPVFLELVQDFTSEYILLPQDHLNRLQGNRPMQLPIQMIELNYIIPEEGNLMRYPLFCSMNGGKIIELGKRLSDKTGWPLFVKIGTKLPEQILNKDLLQLKAQLENDQHPYSEPDYTDALSEEYRLEKRERALKFQAQRTTSTRDVLNKYRPTFWILSLCCFAGGLWLLCSSFHCYQKIAESQSWPSTPGRISTAEIIETGEKKKKKFIPVIEYQYTVEANGYVSDIIEICPRRRSSQAAAEEIVERYPVGKKVEVYYNPVNPKIAVLVRGNKKSADEDRNAGIFLSILGFLTFPNLHQALLSLFGRKGP